MAGKRFNSRRPIAESAGYLLSTLLFLQSCTIQAEDPQITGLQHLQHPVPEVFCGSEPASERVFRELHKLGVRTVVSVDGIRPQVELAERCGLKYVHIPIGYDGISAEQAGMLTRVADEAKDPVYVHCHHGRHRGPAAAAVICRALGRMQDVQAIQFLERSGTSRDYQGLWRDVGGYQRPPVGAVLPQLQSAVPVSSLAERMADLSRRFEMLQQESKADWNSARSGRLEMVVGTAVLLEEGFRESLRQQDDDRDARFHSLMQQSASRARQLTGALKDRKFAKAGEIINLMSIDCGMCHQHYRD